ncbi:hypothetical protein M0804_000289 [Polistes exclamans]|nr:hypothetical protein M0804_000289 [Polistes exclamans]
MQFCLVIDAFNKVCSLKNHSDLSSNTTKPTEDEELGCRDGSGGGGGGDAAAATADLEWRRICGNGS